MRSGARIVRDLDTDDLRGRIARWIDVLLLVERLIEAGVDIELRRHEGRIRRTAAAHGVDKQQLILKARLRREGIEEPDMGERRRARRRRVDGNEDRALERNLEFGTGSIAVGDVLKILRRGAQVDKHWRNRRVGVLDELPGPRERRAPSASRQRRGRICGPIGLLRVRQRGETVSARIEDYPISVAGKVKYAGGVKLDAHVTRERAPRSQPGRIRRHLPTAGRNDERRYQY